MARPNKMGLEYYQFDTDIFIDRKVRRLIKSFNSEGFLTYIFVLTEIYRDKGFYILWNNDISFDVSDQLNIPENLINEIVNFCCEIKLFNKEMLIQNGILTSKSIQDRWSKISKDAKRSYCNVNQINKRYELIQEETTEIQEETHKSTEETPEIPVIMPQSKVKESKVKEIKDSLFENFWELYPNKIARAKCKEKFDALSGDEKQKISDTINDFVKHKPFPEYHHPNPLTYLSQKRWEDDIPKFSATTNQFGAKKNFGRTNQVSYT